MSNLKGIWFDNEYFTSIGKYKKNGIGKIAEKSRKTNQFVGADLDFILTSDVKDWLKFLKILTVIARSYTKTTHLPRNQRNINRNIILFLLV